MSKVKILIVLVLITLLAVPASVSADGLINTIYFDDLEGLLMSRSQQIRDNNNSLGSLGSSAGAEELETLIGIYEGFLAAEPEGTPLYFLLSAQLSSLNHQKTALEGVDDQNEILLSSTELRNYSFIYNIESFYISIKNMEDQIKLLKTRIETMKKQVDAMKLRLELKMVTESAAKQVDNQLRVMETQLQVLQESRDGLLELINVNIGQEYDAELNFAELSEITDFQINSIDINQDYELALLASANVNIAKLQSDDNKEEDAIRKFKKDFYRTHQNLLDKQKALEVEKANSETADFNYKVASLKFELGLMSSLDFNEAKNTYLNSQVTLNSAKNVLFQAYHQYKWAKRGFVFISA